MFVENEEIVVYCIIVIFLSNIVSLQSAIHSPRLQRMIIISIIRKFPRNMPLSYAVFAFITKYSCILMARLPNILVTGTPGTGKTSFADMIAVVVVAGI